MLIVRRILPVVALAIMTAAQEGAAADRLSVVPRARLCVTEGDVADLPSRELAVNSTKMRGYVTGSAGTEIEVRFKYLGGTAQESRLGSGEIRRQFGLKLRAHDACNLVYAMWRIEPESKLVVSVKSNPSQHSSAECGNHGYRNIKPRRSTPVPALGPGSAHRLRAVMSGAELRVFADDTPVWEGSVAGDGMRFDGPVGIRSDNARLEFELWAVLTAQVASGSACRAGDSD